jgi:hypothetical protein
MQRTSTWQFVTGSVGQEFELAGCQWLTPVILATQEAEIRRIENESQPEQIVP